MKKCKMFPVENVVIIYLRAQKYLGIVTIPLMELTNASPVKIVINNFFKNYFMKDSAYVSIILEIQR